MRSLSLFLLFCLNFTPYHVQPFPFPSVIQTFTPYHAQLFPLPSVLSELYPLSCKAFPFSFCSVLTSPLIMCSLSLFLQLFRYLHLIMRSFTLYLLFCLNFTPYHAQPFPFHSVLSELYPLLCAAFPLFFCSV
jgi:hypothetical protein